MNKSIGTGEEELRNAIGNQQKFIRTNGQNPSGDPRENGREQCLNHLGNCEETEGKREGAVHKSLGNFEETWENLRKSAETH